MSQNSFTDPVNAIFDRAAQGADPAIQAVQQAAHHAVDSLSQSAHGLQADASRLDQINAVVQKTVKRLKLRPRRRHAVARARPKRPQRT